MTLLAENLQLDKKGKVVPPAPLVKATRHPFKWTRLKATSILYGVLFAHIGMFIVTGLYYGLFETTPFMNHLWHTAVSNSDLRHAIRNVGEGVLGGLLAQQILWNHYKKGALKRGKLLGWLEKMPIAKHATALTLAVVFGVVAFLVGFEALHLLHVHGHNASYGPHASLWQRTQPIWAGNFDQKLLGYVAAFATHKPLRIVFDDVQKWFVLRKYDKGKRARFYHAPTFRARYNGLKAAYAAGQVKRHYGWQNTVFSVVVLASVGLAGLGWYVLTYIAGG